MPAPAMPTTMRGDGRGTKLRQQKPTGRYFAGKGAAEDQQSESEEEEEENEQEREEAEEDEEEEKRKSGLQMQFKEVDLQRHYEQERILETQRREIEAENAARGSGSDYDTENSEKEESSEEEEAPRRVLSRPTFIPKSKRTTQTAAVIPENGSNTTTNETKASPAPDTVLDDHQKRRLEARALIEHQIRLESTLHKSQEDIDDTGAELNDSDSHSSPEESFNAWKLRELLRIRRDRDVIEARESERQEIEARRRVPDEIRLVQDIARVAEEREAAIAAKREDREIMGVSNPSTTVPGAAGGTGGGGGKYHHRGGFFQDDPIHRRKATSGIEVTHLGTGGLRGATRWRGLGDSDTSRDGLWEPRRDGREQRKRGIGAGAGAGGGVGEECDEKGRKRRG